MEPILDFEAAFSFSLFFATLLAANYTCNTASCITALFGYFYLYNSVDIGGNSGGVEKDEVYSNKEKS